MSNSKIVYINMCPICKKPNFAISIVYDEIKTYSHCNICDNEWFTPQQYNETVQRIKELINDESSQNRLYELAPLLANVRIR